MFKIITKKEYNRLVSSVKNYSEIVESQNKLLKTYKKRIENKNILNLELNSKINELESVIVQLRKQLLILTPYRDAVTGRFIPKYNSKKNEKKQV